MVPIQNLSQLSNQDLQSFLDSFDDVLCDCDGVIMSIGLENKYIKGVEKTIQALRNNGKKVYFVSNNSSTRLALIHKRLNSSSVKIDEDDIANPTLSIIDYLKSINFNKKLYLFGTSSMREDLQEAGFQVVEQPSNDDVGVKGVMEILTVDPEVAAVVVDIDWNLTYSKLMKASVYLEQPDVLFITGATDRAMPVRNLATFIGPEYFQNILQEVCKKEPIQCGKPSQNMHKYITKRFNLGKPSRTLFVGDTLSIDIKFAAQCGYQKLLVLSGLSDMEEVNNTKDEALLPDYVLESFGELHTLIQKSNQ